MRPFVASLALVLAGCPGGPPASGDQCVGCHVGIEPMMPSIADDSCVICHGGDRDGRTVEDAHVAVPENWAAVRGTVLPPAPDGYIRDFMPAQLDQLSVEYVRFINPGDMRAVDRTCGVCHSEIVETWTSSVMTTNAGHYMPSRHLAGLQGLDAIYAAGPAADPNCDLSIEGTVCEVEAMLPQPEAEVLQAFDDNDVDALQEIGWDHYLAKSCGDCHASGFGPNDSPHRYRSAGCTSCHVLYGSDGLYLGNDPVISRTTPVHPMRHEVTTAIPSEQCATCHFQGGRIGLLFRGIREGGFSETPEFAETWDETAFGHTPGFYILDEDTRNDVDETPPDLHFAAGMHCADCHVGTDVHGTGRIYTTAKQQVDLRCEDCHGTVRQAATADDSGIFRTESGRPLPQLSRADGAVVLTGVVDGVEHVVPQPAALLADGGTGTAAMHRAMGLDGDWSHTDSLTCDTCHTSYNQVCIGCHVSFDARLSQVDDQTGEPSIGFTRGSRQTYSLDTVLLVQAPDGRVQTSVPSAHAQLTVVDPEGNLAIGGLALDEQGQPTEQVRGVFRKTETSDANIGFPPFFQHTTSAKPRSCSTCHRTDDTEQEWARVRGVYGFGTGEFMLPHPDGPPVDALQFLAEDGTPLVDWFHRDTGPVPAQMRDRALGIVVTDEAPAVPHP